MSIHAKSLFTTSLLFCGMSSSFAEMFQPKATPPAMENIVVTGTRTERALEDSPVSVDVVSGAEVQRITRGSLADALNYLPGVTIRPNEKDGTNVLINGFDGDRVLVLVDGQPLVAPTGNAADLGQISALDIERIEIIRGAASVLYGSSAMGGVINVITKKEQKTLLEFSFDRGDFDENALENDSYRQEMSLSATAYYANLTTSLTHQQLNHPGFDYNPEQRAVDAGSVERTFTRASTHLNTHARQYRIEVRDINEQKYRITGYFPGGGDDFYRSSVDQNQISLSTQSNANWQLSTRFSTHRELSCARGNVRHSDIEQVNIDGQQSFSGVNSEWVAGFHYFQERLNQEKQDGTSEINNKQDNTIEAFLQRSVFVGHAWELLGGIRLQRDSGYGEHSVLRFNSVWRENIAINQTLIWRTAIGQGYRAPTLKERYFNFDHSNLGYHIIGNGELAPENSLSLNSSITHTLNLSPTRSITSEFALHRSDANNFIATELDSNASSDSGISVFRYQNFGEITLQGADFSVSYTSERQKLQLDYSYLDARNAQTKDRLSERPYHQIKTNYTWRDKSQRIETVLYVLYERDEASLLRLIDNDFLSVNAVLNVHLSDQFSLRAGVNNMLDEHAKTDFDRQVYFDPRPVDSRYLFLGASFRFK